MRLATSGSPIRSKGVPVDRFYDTPNARVHSIAYGNGRFVAVGERGAVVVAMALAPTNYSARWINISGVSDDNLIGVEYGNGMYLAISDGGMVMTSPDGIEWTRHWLGMRGNLTGEGVTSLAYGNGLFVAVARSRGFMFSSPDGTNWTRRGHSTLGSNGFMDVAFGNGMFMAVGHNPSYTMGDVQLSPDGLTWTPGAGGIQSYGPFLRVDCDGPYFVLTRKDGSLMHTTDTQTWIQGKPFEDWEWPTRAFDTPHGKVNAWTDGLNGTIAVGDGCLILQASQTP